MATGIVLNLAVGASTLIGFWFIYLWRRNTSIVDLGWATGLTLMGLAHNLCGAPSLGKLLTSLLVLLWGLRLGGYLFWTRLRLGKKDRRYDSLHGDGKIPEPMRVLLHYLIQACFQTAVGCVFIFTARAAAGFDSIWTVIGLFLWCAGFVGSFLADNQLNWFRSNPQNLGKVCEVGFWNNSRHPNYFFEIVLWTGFAVIGLSSAWGWLGFASPGVLLLTMALITGPISEQQSLKSKPDAYRRYQETTSMIVPWFKKDRSA